MAVPVWTGEEGKRDMFNGDGYASAADKPAGPEILGATDNQLLRENAKLKQELAEVKDELKRLKDIMADKEEHKKMMDQDAEFHTRYWLPDEHQRFLTGLKMYGHKDIKSIARFVGTRSSTQVTAPPKLRGSACGASRALDLQTRKTGAFRVPAGCASRRRPLSDSSATRTVVVQVRTHAQKYFMKIEKHGKTLGEVGLPERPEGCSVGARSVTCC